MGALEFNDSKQSTVAIALISICEQLSLGDGKNRTMKEIRGRWVAAGLSPSFMRPVYTGHKKDAVNRLSWMLHCSSILCYRKRMEISWTQEDVQE